MGGITHCWHKYATLQIGHWLVCPIQIGILHPWHSPTGCWLHLMGWVLRVPVGVPVGQCLSMASQRLSCIGTVGHAGMGNKANGVMVKVGLGTVPIRPASVWKKE